MNTYKKLHTVFNKEISNFNAVDFGPSLYYLLIWKKLCPPSQIS